MATTTKKRRNIQYLGRDFNSLKTAFIEQHLKPYFPDTIQDFNESSVGMMLTEIGAFFGDNINFYLDKRFAESFTETAQETKNVFRHAKQLGFKAFGKTAAIGTVDGFIKVPVLNQNGQLIPDMRYAGTIKKGAKLKNRSGKTYETLEDADFSKIDITDSRYVQVATRDTQSNQPLSYVLKLVNIAIKAGETKTTTVAVGDFERFYTTTLVDDDVLEIIKITDSDSNQWYEVDFLAQDTVFDSSVNNGPDYTDVPYVLKLRSVPYRFITDYNFATNKTSIIFGSGDADTFDGDLIPDLGDLSLPAFGKDTFTDFSLDPQNFLNTSTLGLAPVNTTLTIQYRVGGGSDTNAGAGEIDTVADKVFDVADSSLNQSTIKDVGNSFGVTNPFPVQGGNDEIDVETLKHLIPSLFASQARLVNPPDFIARTLSMPAKFGSVFRANAKLNPLNTNSVELIILSKDANGFITTAPQQLKENLKTYLSRFRMMTDAIEIMDGEVINLDIGFSILCTPEAVKTEVLSNCILALQDFFDTNTFAMNQPINYTDIYTLLADIDGVLSVISIDIKNLVGNIDGFQYSQTPFNIQQNTKNNILYCQENAIFEVKYKNKNIHRSGQVNGLVENIFKFR